LPAPFSPHGNYVNARSGHLLRRIRLKAPNTGERLISLTNNFALGHHRILSTPLEGRAFLQMGKQHLRINQFYDTPKDAVRTQTGKLRQTRCFQPSELSKMRSISLTN
jgi:hypothetical protein